MDDMTKKVPVKAFLKDVLVCSLGAYGGPEAHYGVFTDQMVTKKKYLSEEDMVELIALTGILPGPSSTQTILSIGYKIGGPVLAGLTLLVWALPAVIMMTVFSFMYAFLARAQLDADGLRLIGPMAVGFITVAAIRLGRKVIKGYLTAFLFLFGAITTFFMREVWVFPLVLILGGFATVMASKEKGLWYSVRLNPPWKYLIAFGVIAIVSAITALLINQGLIFVFDHFYRYGYLVIGGGQVVIPYMFSDLVEHYQLMTSAEFLTGFGLVQGIPGPMFSFSAYAGGLALRDSGPVIQALGGLIAAIGIFLPGTLLIFFVYPIWENLKKIKGIKVSLSGVTAVAAGLIAIAAVILMRESGFTLINVIVWALTVILLWTKKIPAPLIVLAVIIAGFLI